MARRRASWARRAAPATTTPSACWLSTRPATCRAPAPPAAWPGNCAAGSAISPIVGAGLYVDNDVGAATSTGVGEEVIRNVGSFLVVELMRQGRSPQDACKEAVARILKKKPNAKDIQVGFLALSKTGEAGAWSIQKGFTCAAARRRAAGSAGGGGESLRKPGSASDPSQTLSAVRSSRARSGARTLRKRYSAQRSSS